MPMLMKMPMPIDSPAVFGRVPPLTLRHTTDLSIRSRWARLWTFRTCTQSHCRSTDLPSPSALPRPMRGLRLKEKIGQQGRKAATRASFPPCWVLWAPRCRLRRHRRAPLQCISVCCQQTVKTVSSQHPICPRPRRREYRPGTVLRFSGSAVRRDIT